jgi:hypothetical protein
MDAFKDLPAFGQGSKIIESSFNNLVNSSIPSLANKVTEIGGNLAWEASSNFQKYSGLAIPKDFSALTNSLNTDSMSKAVGGLAKTFPFKMPGPLGAMIPFGQDLKSGNGIDVEDGTGTGKGIIEHGVKLVSRINPGDIFFCEIMPTISESGGVNYDAISPIHHPGDIIKYTNTPSREWSISGIKLASVTPEEASYNQMLINLLRSWRMPYYGDGTAAGKNKSKLGAPPDVLFFSAYGKQNIGEIPVVMSSLSIEWPNDCDYIHTAGKDQQPFPVLLNISIGLKEAWSPKQYSGFSLEAFRAGNLTEAYGAKAVATVAAKGTNVNASQANGEAPGGKVAEPNTMPADVTGTDVVSAKAEPKVLDPIEQQQELEQAEYMRQAGNAGMFESLDDVYDRTHIKSNTMIAEEKYKANVMNNFGYKE